ncbi:MAG: hypothetical protein DELT_01223 [Desulfovibrio sp.]
MIDSAPLISLLKIAGTFAVMLIAIRRRAPLWLAILLGGVALSLLFGLSVPEMGGVFITALTQQSFITLFLVIFCIMCLSEAQAATGQSKRLVASLAPYMRSTRLQLAFFPALVGLLPMPGGAVFSCPMIRDVSEQLDMRGSHKVLINYWFRHIWESAWPLYPGYILVCSLANISPSVLWRYTFPFVFIASFAGWYLLLKKPIKLQEGLAEPVAEKRPPLAVVMEALPIIIAIGGALVIDSVTAGLLPSGSSFIISFIAATAVALLQNKMSPVALAKLVFRPHVGKMLALIAVIFIFKEQVIAARVVDSLAPAMSGKAAMLALFLFLPILMGLLTGIMLGFVGAAFPLLMALLTQTGSYEDRLVYIMVGLAGGHFGQMISPMHACYLVTLEFFKVPLAATWGAIFKTSTLYIVLTLAYIALLYFTVHPVI